MIRDSADPVRRDTYEHMPNAEDTSPGSDHHPADCDYTLVGRKHYGVLFHFSDVAV